MNETTCTNGRITINRMAGRIEVLFPDEALRQESTADLLARGLLLLAEREAAASRPTKPSPVPTPVKEWTPPAKESLADFMKLILSSEDYLILDTETTGLDAGEICQIAIINRKGDVLMDDLVRTVRPIPQEAQRIHGITDQMTENAIPWKGLRERVANLLHGRHVIVFNATYDRKMMHKSDEAAGVDRFDWRGMATWHCAMEAYGEFSQVWNDYFGNWRWFKLADACNREGINVSGAHRALGDCHMTRLLLDKMALSYVLTK